jgi:predicted transcriptional regulator
MSLSYLYVEEGDWYMTIGKIIEILECDIICGGEHSGKPVLNACGADMMSDVLAYVKDQSVLLTGLVNPQVIRTADMMDMICIVFVRGKAPSEEMIALAHEKGNVLLRTRHRMFTACGLLYQSGFSGGVTDDEFQ